MQILSHFHFNFLVFILIHLSFIFILGPDLIHHPMATLSMHDPELSLSPSNLYMTSMRGLMANEEAEGRNDDPSMQMDEQISLAQVEGTIV